MRSRHLKHLPPLLSLLLVAVLSLCACGKQGSRPANPADEAKDAKGLEIYREGDCWVAKVISPTDSAQNLGVYIFPDSDNTANIPEADGAYIFPPSRRGRIMLYTSVYASALRELESQEIIKIVGDASYMTDPYVTENLKSGNITDGGMQQEPDIESIMSARPDMILVSHYDGMDATKLEKTGVPVIYLRESSEAEPLGRAEWIKLIGLIAGKKEKADSIFAKVRQDYQAMAQSVAGNKDRKPLVMTENMYEGSWFLPGGQSYAAKMIRDAGGRYIWDDDKSAGSLQMGFEAVLDRASEADIWLLKTFGKDLTLEDLEKQDSRYLLFKPAKSGGVWNANTREVPFYDETPFHPELLLQDYIAIFHPDVIPAKHPRYFKPVRQH